MPKKYPLASSFIEFLNKKRGPRFLDESHLFRNAPLTYIIIAIAIGLTILMISLLAITQTNKALLVEIPTEGGTLREGITEIPRYINPVLAISRADKDLTKLVHSGLMRKTRSGALAPDLAERYSLSEDRRTYTFYLRDDIYFHDGSHLTAEDVAFTIGLVQDPAINSPELGNWAGVEVNVVGPQEIQLTLPEPYAPFLYNTTLGVLPKHLWEQTSAEQFAFNAYNIEAIGAGPFVIKGIKRKNGVPEVFHLTGNERYALGSPYLTNLFIHIYTDEIALLSGLERGEIHSTSGITPTLIENTNTENISIKSVPLPRVFHVYLNQNRSDAFTEEEVRSALTYAIDRNALVETVFKGYANPTDRPLPPHPLLSETRSNTDIMDIERAKQLLDDAGWIFESATSTARTKEGVPLMFRLATANNPELTQTAEIVAQQLSEIGVTVELEFYDQQTLVQNIIRPREFQALLFGASIDPGLDIYPLWHSSQRNDPGLNVAQYTNIDVDAYLERARTLHDPEMRSLEVQKAVEEIQNDVPTIPLYSPHFIYVQARHVHNNDIEYITEPHDRFADAHTWFVETRAVWIPFGTDK